ncbi:MAG: hypothetical protein FWJ66_11855 [Caldibacillus sp.]
MGERGQKGEMKMRVTTYVADYVKVIIKEKTQLPLEGVKVKTGNYDFNYGIIWVEIEIDRNADIPLYNEKYRLIYSLDDDSGYLYDYQKNKKVYEWG